MYRQFTGGHIQIQSICYSEFFIRTLLTYFIQCIVDAFALVHVVGFECESFSFVKTFTYTTLNTRATSVKTKSNKKRKKKEAGIIFLHMFVIFGHQTVITWNLFIDFTRPLRSHTHTYTHTNSV